MGCALRFLLPGPGDGVGADQCHACRAVFTLYARHRFDCLGQIPVSAGEVEDLIRFGKRLVTVEPVGLIVRVGGGLEEVEHG